ncbi:MAG TPA: Gfo/Idh/MocA family oxidoreductase [Gemmatimonadaceae bacterium]|nr:Gfo/Idh/MocA family oxidoreductase [Gemmatimonadaceae bacterium]
MRIGVIGVGRIGRYHAGVLASHPGVDRVVVHDIDEARARATAVEVDAELAESADALLDRVDAVVIAAPTSLHGELIRRAVDAGRPTFCEKPITLDLESTADVVRHVRDSGVPVQIGFQRRFDAGYLRARAMVADGTLGMVYVVRIAAHDPAPPHEEYIPHSGGMYRDLHIHDFDIVPFVLGQEVTEVYATGAVLVSELFEKYGDVDTTAAVFRFSEGTLGILSGARHDPLGYDIRTEFFGSRDSIVVGWDARTPLRSVEPGMPGTPRDAYAFFVERFDAAYRAEMDAFLTMARERGPSPCPPEVAEAALRIAVACDRSRAERRAVRMDEIGDRG